MTNTVVELRSSCDSLQAIVCHPPASRSYRNRKVCYHTYHQIVHRRLTIEGHCPMSFRSVCYRVHSSVVILRNIHYTIATLYIALSTDVSCSSIPHANTVLVDMLVHLVTAVGQPIECVSFWLEAEWKACGDFTTGRDCSVSRFCPCYVNTW